MIAAEVQFYDVVVWLHITAVVLAFGPGFSYGMFFAVAGKSNPAALPTIARVILLWSGTVARAALLVILASGLYLTDERFDFGDFFVSWGMAAIVVLFALAELFFRPRTLRFIEAAEAGRAEEAQAIAGPLNKAGPLFGLIVVLTLYMMSAKPFL